MDVCVCQSVGVEVSVTAANAEEVALPCRVVPEAESGSGVVCMVWLEKGVLALLEEEGVEDFEAVEAG